MKVKIVSRILTFVGIGACARLSHRSCQSRRIHSLRISERCLLPGTLGPFIHRLPQCT
jgi:hypothetical protein